MRTILACCILLLFVRTVTFLEMGCPPPESELHNILIKAMHKNGCSGCSPEGEITNYVLVYLAEGNGSVTGEATQTVAENTDGTPVTAAANPGYHFTQWSDGLQEATRQDTAVTADLSVTAQFAINTLTAAGYWVTRTSKLDLSLIHISEPTRLLSISYAVFCLKKKKKTTKTNLHHKYL